MVGPLARVDVNDASRFITNVIFIKVIILTYIRSLRSRLDPRVNR